MSLADRLKKKNAETRVAGKHPLIELGADRAVRAAYFQGLALVALVDDDVIDDKERAYLQKLGGALGLTQDEITETISAIEDLKGNDDAQECVVGEVIDSVTDSVMRKLFLAEFTCLSTVHDHSWEKVKDLRVQFAQMMECDLEAAGFKLFDEVVLGLPKTAIKIPTLEKSFSQPMLDYLFTGYREQIKKELEMKSAEAKKAEADESAKLKELEDWLVKFIETGNAYDEKVIRAKFAWAGIKDHFQTTLLKLMLPHARRAEKAFYEELDQTGVDSRDSDYGYITIGKTPSGLKLSRYCSFLDKNTKRDGRYGVLGQVTMRSGWSSNSDDRNKTSFGDYGYAEVSRIYWKWRSTNGEREAKKACRMMFERILTEFEFRATW